MRAIVAECVRYFMKPYCFQMPPDHVHTTRCWDEEFHSMRETLLNAESDARALKKANTMLKAEIFDLKERLAPSRTTSGIRGQRSDFVWVDEVGSFRDIGDVGVFDRSDVKKLLDDAFGSPPAKKPTPVHHERDDRVIRFVSPTGQEMFRTPDGKRFMTKDAAARHMQLLRKRP